MREGAAAESLPWVNRVGSSLRLAFPLWPQVPATIGHIHFARLKTLENLNSFCQPATTSNIILLFVPLLVVCPKTGQVVGD
jgi:hypothetical protein